MDLKENRITVRELLATAAAREVLRRELDHAGEARREKVQAAPRVRSLTHVQVRAREQVSVLTVLGLLAAAGLAAVNLVAQEQKAGRLVGCVEEIALQKGYISREDVARLSEELSGCEYGQCLRRCL